MFSKLYDKFKGYIKENYICLILFILVVFLFTFKFPYYISAPGGLIDTKDRVSTSSDFKLSGSLNMAYVSSFRATFPMLLYAFVNPDYDIENISSVTTGSESIEDEEYRNKMLLKESNNMAVLTAYKYSNIPYTISNDKLYVTYVDDLAKSNLKVSDRLLSIDGKKILNKEFLYNYLKGKKPSDKVSFEVLRDGKKIKRKATLLDVNGKAKIGILVTETMDINSSLDTTFNFKSTESGSSGGLMLALTVYSYLNKVDLTSSKVIAGTGTIDADGNVGAISGVKYKLIGAYRKGAKVFLVPKGSNYKEALKVKKEKGYDIEVVSISSFDEALEYLKG